MRQLGTGRLGKLSSNKALPMYRRWHSVRLFSQPAALPFARFELAPLNSLPRNAVSRLFQATYSLATIAQGGENVRRFHLPTEPANGDNRLSRPVSRVIALLALAALINYIDRGNLSIAASLLKDELGLSASQLGILLS